MYMEANICRTRCPRKALEAAENREVLRDAVVHRTLIMTYVGAVGVLQMLRTASCPQRKLSEETYTPAESCVAIVADQLQEKPISPILLTESEQVALDPFLRSPESIDDN